MSFWGFFPKFLMLDPQCSHQQSQCPNVPDLRWFHSCGMLVSTIALGPNSLLGIRTTIKPSSQWEIFRILKWSYDSSILQAIFWGYIPWTRGLIWPYIWYLLYIYIYIYGRYLQSIGSCCMAIDQELHPTLPTDETTGAHAIVTLAPPCHRAILGAQVLNGCLQWWGPVSNQMGWWTLRKWGHSHVILHGYPYTVP